MLVRLLGKEEEAKTGKWTTPFTDVADWAKPYVGYAYTNGLTTGTSATTFGGNATVNASEYLTFVLRALGYESGTDFQWDKAWELSDQIGLTNREYDANTVNFTRGDVAVVSCQGLDCKLKGSSTSLQDTFPVKVTDIQLNQSALELEINATKLLTASVAPDNATDKTVIWKSSNSSVATVSGGEVKAIKSGSATITATTSNGLYATCEVTVTAAPIVYSGNGDKVITGVNIPAGSYYAEYAHSGSRNFISKLVYGEKSYDNFRISNEIGNCSGQVALYDEGNVGVNDGILEVEADGDWKISFMPVSGSTTTNIKGTGERVTGLFTATTANTVVSTTHSGSRNFIVKAIKYNGTKSYDYESIANEIGNYSGEKLIRLEKGAQYFFYVRADGDWTIDLGLGDTLTTYDKAPLLSSSSSSSSTTNSNTTNTETGNVAVPLINHEYGPMTLTSYYSTGRYWDENKISSLVFTKIEYRNTGKYKLYMSLQGITDDSTAHVDVYFYDANNRVLDQVSFLPDVQPNVEYNVLYTKYVDKDVIENAVRIAFFSHSGNAATKGTGTSSGNSDASASKSESTLTGNDISDLVNYISNYGTKASSSSTISKTNSEKTKTSISYHPNAGVLTFTFNYQDGKCNVGFDYDISTQSVNKIHVAGVGNRVSLLASCTADFDIANYTSSTNLKFTKDYEDSSLTTYVTNYEELCNILVRMAIPSFGLLMVDTAGITLADIGFDSY